MRGPCTQYTTSPFAVNFRSLVWEQSELNAIEQHQLQLLLLFNFTVVSFDLGSKRPHKTIKFAEARESLPYECTAPNALWYTTNLLIYLKTCTILARTKGLLVVQNDIT